MNKKLIIAIIAVLIFGVVVSGYFTSLREENSILSKELAELKEKSKSLEGIIEELNNKLKEEQMTLESSSRPAFSNNSNIYPIYTADVNTYELEKDAYVYISEGTPLKQKLDILADALSVAYFDSNPIEVLRIAEVDNKKIAVIDLREKAENLGKIDPKDTKGKTWAFLYMQGSTGGTVTQTRLIETMLQKEYQGQWVDGVKFLYNGGVCNYEHAPLLKDINYRY